MKLSQEEQVNRASASHDYLHMICGKRIVMSAERYMNVIDYCGSRIRISELASCQNRLCCGLLDRYVAWIGTENKPADLEFGKKGSLHAVGSV